MAYKPDDTDIPALLKELDRLANNTTDRLSAAVNDVDKIIDILTQAREQIAQSPDPHTASLTLARLQNPVSKGFEAIDQDLRKVDKVRKHYGKVLDKNFPPRPLPTDDDAMAKHPELINRAIAMHLLREGQFNVASTFIQETQALDQFQEQEPIHEESAPGPSNPARRHDRSSHPNDDTDMDADHSEDEEEGEDDDTIPNQDSRGAAEAGYDGGDDEPMSEVRSLQSSELQEKFATMYQILKELRNHNLLPAISWAHENSNELDARGSDLEFELCKRQYIYLIQQSGSGDEEEGPAVAMEYAQANFPRFADRHAKEIAQLASALVYQPNLADSPYAHLFAGAGGDGFDEIASSFTREFCSLLGLSAESPLYVAATAGAISLPRLMMFVGVMTQARASWTTASELAFDTPLPRSMIYHSIFVCPVSKEQTTDRNPPMMLPCGHVLAKDSLKNLVKSHQRYKCPYCPVEGLLRDARQIIL
ncbi:regulator of gluconeosis [Diaporthe amygdali]|uniref:regulator of gluconeosis n=1 Tax=Phomopsis amygdali TaxID=1214568 RepID=UPI0022FEAE17|nr:regulator of gluconeosis [Diaporthe amygdali]KAJ0122447.1 regulator of gluconeosis [Diaporthe amygdali]